MTAMTDQSYGKCFPFSEPRQPLKQKSGFSVVLNGSRDASPDFLYQYYYCYYCYSVHWYGWAAYLLV